MNAKTTTPEEQSSKNSFCAVPAMPERKFSEDVNANRLGLIRLIEKKWVNGTVLHYYFFDQEGDGEQVFFNDGSTELRTWQGSDAEKEVVRQAFKVWKDVGIGLEFKEVGSRDEAEVRIGFMKGNGAWSYLGRDILTIGADKRTMNFGWDITRSGEIDTVIHEIGHTLGFPHEHQNPNAGIVWNEEAVYEALAQPPNLWPRERTYHNIIKKINPDTVQGSNWDPDSVMHYPFGPGMIESPEAYQGGLSPAGGLSARDKTWVRTFYPPLDDDKPLELVPFKSVPLSIAEGQQQNLIFKPKVTREYQLQTFGLSDTVMVLFEEVNGELKYRAGDDDSGEAYNANIKMKLIKGHTYIVRTRLFYSHRAGETAVMVW